MSFSDEIKTIRKKSLLTQTEFADEIQVSFSTVNRWENGKGKPNLSAMKALRSYCEAHNISYENLEAEWFSSQSK